MSDATQPGNESSAQEPPALAPAQEQAQGQGQGQGHYEADPALDALVAVCEAIGRFGGSGDPSYFDGYLTAIATSRRFIDSEEWLPLLGEEAFERAFADPDSAAQALHALDSWLLMRRLELDPERMMDRPDDIFLTPLIDYWSDENRQAMEHSSQQARAQASAAGTVSDDVQEPEAEFLPYSGCVWAYGFLTAVDDFSADWPDPSMHGDREAREDAETYFALLELINALTQDPSSKHYQAFAASQWSGEPPTREELVQEVCFAVQDLRFHWLNHAAKPAPRHVEAAPGRNEPCPCGSGKKFKKCHGGVG